MDNICHSLVGAAMGESGLKRRTRFGAAALLVSANLPDLDVLVFATSIPPVAFRRGWTHGIGAQLLLPVLFTAVLWLIGRLRPRDDAPPMHVGWLLLLSYAGVWSHVFLDYLNTYGVRLLTPLDWRWFYGDAVFIVDPWLWLACGLGIWLARRRGQTMPARRALFVSVCYIAAMMMIARTGRATVADAWRDAHGSEPRALMVGPVPLLPMTREVIVDAGDHYERGRLSWPSSVMFDGQAIPKNGDRPEVARARAAPDIQAFLVWSRFPFWTVTPERGGVRVTVADARFMAGGRMFSASTVVSATEGGSN
jgi:inner membrane protein